MRPEEKTILIVGDDPSTKRLVASIARGDWVVEFAHDQTDALARIKAQSAGPDCSLLTAMPAEAS